MSEENQNEPMVINNDLTEKIKNAYLATTYSLLGGGDGGVVLIEGEKDGETVGIKLTLMGLKEAAESMGIKTETETTKE